MNQSCASHKSGLAAIVSCFLLVCVPTGRGIAQMPNRGIASRVSSQELICRDCAPPHATVRRAPPIGFNALKASARQLELYGFPPRPDPANETGSYKLWKRIVSLAMRSHRIDPILLPMNIRGHLLETSSSPKTPDGKITGDTSANWSGFAIGDPNNPFAPKGYIEADIVVPRAQPPFGTCDGTYYQAGLWVGIDGARRGGATSTDILQAGISANAVCL